MDMRFWIVDAFATSLFEGNPAAVCWLEGELPEEDLQKIAREFNVHETVFVTPLQNQHFRVQIFTPKAHESVSGHGLLAAAHVLWHEGMEIFADKEASIYFETSLGIFLTTIIDGKMTLHTVAKVAEPAAVPDRLINALGTPPIAVSRCGQIYVVEMFSPKHVLKLEPDITKLEKVVCRGVVVTAEGGNDVRYDFMSRFFAPSEGFKEDAVTLWNHCFLGPYWAHRLGRTSFVAMQTSNRTGYLGLECVNGQVRISGECTTSMRGEIAPLPTKSRCGDLFEAESGVKE